MDRLIAAAKVQPRHMSPGVAVSERQIRRMVHANSAASLSQSEEALAAMPAAATGFVLTALAGMTVTQAAERAGVIPVAVPVHPVGGQYRTTLYVNGHALPALVDTGSTSTTVRLDVLMAMGLQSVLGTVMVITIDGKEHHQPLYEVGLSLAPSAPTFRHFVSGGHTGSDRMGCLAIIGMDVLNRYITILDGPARVMTILVPGSL